MFVQRHALFVSCLVGLLTTLVDSQEIPSATPSIVVHEPGSGSDISNVTKKILIITLCTTAGAFLLFAGLCVWIRGALANRRQMPKSLPPGYPGYHQEKGKAVEAQAYQQSNISTGSFLPPYPGQTPAETGTETPSASTSPPAINTQTLGPISVIVDAPSPTYAPPKTVDSKTMNSARTRTTSNSKPSGPTSFFFSSSSSSSSTSSSSSSSKPRERGVTRSNSKLANLVGMGHNFTGDHDGSLNTTASIEQGRNAGFGLGYDDELASQYEQQQNKRASAILMEQVLNTPPRSPSPSQMMFGSGGGGSGSNRSSYDYGLYGHGRNLSTSSTISAR
ncbi:hypothetical protein BGW42_001376 [Actinomortierella wolfii]|nr:hypothetical protein BGW42_001376 [Actinomortierella wolfii]